MSVVTEIMNSITYSKKDLTKESFNFEKDYNPYIINKCVANNRDLIFYAAALSMYSLHIPKKYQYLYYLISIRPKKRFAKWYKSEKESKDIEVIKEYYKVNSKVAKEYLRLLNEEQIKEITKKVFKGGNT